MVKRSRGENLDKFGQNNAKEAAGLALVRSALADVGILHMRRSAEGARADFSVFFPGADCAAIGVQLKTCHSLTHRHGRCFYQFSKTSGYDGLLLLMMAMVEDTPRMWLRRGCDNPAGQTEVPVFTKQLRKHDWAGCELQLAGLSAALEQAFGVDGIDIRSVEDFVRPSCATHVVEFEAQLRLEKQLPLLYEAPDVEHQAYDYKVGAARWQMKVASYDQPGDRFSARLCRMAGEAKTVQYAATDFDWLAVLLPEHPVLQAPTMYLIPIHALVERGFVGRKASRAGNLRVTPHRGGVAWAEAFRIDLSTPQLALQQYERVRYGSGPVA